MTITKTQETKISIEASNHKICWNSGRPGFVRLWTITPVDAHQTGPRPECDISVEDLQPLAEALLAMKAKIEAESK